LAAGLTAACVLRGGLRDFAVRAPSSPSPQPAIAMITIEITSVGGSNGLSRLSDWQAIIFVATNRLSV
jgi:hypothetical protein